MKGPEIMICQCSSMEHQLVYWKDPEDRQVYMSVYLAPLPLLERIWAAIRYVFGYRCRYGHWEEFVLGEEHGDQLRQIADTIDPNDSVWLRDRSHASEVSRPQ